MKLEVNPAIVNSTLYWAVPPSNISLNDLSSPNNMPITFYDESTYYRQQQLAEVLKWAELVSYVLLLGGIFCDKVIGVELFGAWQTAFFSIANIDKLQPLLYPLAKLKTVNGINTFLSFGSAGLP